MSRLYEKYENLKKANESIIYLFKCGNFYIALDSDAIILNELFNMKLTRFSNLCDKCGFPINSLDKYKQLFDNKNIKYEIIEIDNKSQEKKLMIIKDLLDSLDLEKIEKDECILILKDLHQLIME